MRIGAVTGYGCSELLPRSGVSVNASETHGPSSEDRLML